MTVPEGERWMGEWNVKDIWSVEDLEVSLLLGMWGWFGRDGTRVNLKLEDEALSHG